MLVTCQSPLKNSPMKTQKQTSLGGLILIIVFMNVCLSSCYGPRLNKKHEESISNNNVLAVVSDINLKIKLDELMVRNTQGSWAKDANWDEYKFIIDNLSNQNITIENITVIDGLNREVFPESNRRALNKQTRLMKNRFKKAGIKIKLGKGSTNIVTTSVTGVVLGTGLGAGVASGGSVAVSAGTLTTAGGAVVVAVPAIAIGGIIKIVNNSKVNNRIQDRQTLLPLQMNDRLNLLDIFYPATPSPTQINVTYLIDEQKHSLNLMLPENFKALHYHHQKTND